MFLSNVNFSLTVPGTYLENICKYYSDNSHEIFVYVTVLISIGAIFPVLFIKKNYVMTDMKETKRCLFGLK